MHLLGQIVLEDKSMANNLYNTYVISFFDLLLDMLDESLAHLLNKKIEKIKDQKSFFNFVDWLRYDHPLNDIDKPDSLTLTDGTFFHEYVGKKRKRNSKELSRLLSIKYTAAYLAELQMLINQLSLKPGQAKIAKWIIHKSRLKFRTLRPVIGRSRFARSWEFHRWWKFHSLYYLKKLFKTIKYIKSNRGRLRVKFDLGTVSDEFRTMFEKVFKVYFRGDLRAKNFPQKFEDRKDFFWKFFLAELRLIDFPRKTRLPYGVYRHLAPNKHKINNQSFEYLEELVDSLLKNDQVEVLDKYESKTFDERIHKLYMSHKKNAFPFRKRKSRVR